MFKHSIIKHKEPDKVYTGWNSASRAKYKTQEEYDKYIQDNPWVVGDFVTLCTYPIVYVNSVAVITGIETQYEKLIWSYHNGLPLAYSLMGLSLANVSPWKRNDEMQGYRKLTDEEFNQFIRPNFDSIQDYCKQHAGLEGLAV